MRSVMPAKVREADAHSPKHWAAGPTTSSNQQTLGYDLAASDIVAVWQAKSAAAARKPGENKCTDMSIDR